MKKRNKEEKTKKQSKVKRNVLKPIQSTQQNIPIREIVDGVIVTKDKQFIKILEVKPITFNLKSYTEQTRIFESFKNVLKLCPSSVQLTSMSFPANLDKQLNNLEKEMMEEKNAKCLEIDKEYKKKLERTQYEGTTRRFFLTIKYEGRRPLFKSGDINGIIYDLNQTANTIISMLHACGNEVVKYNPEDQSGSSMEILYTILNRKKSIKTPFKKRLNEVVNHYYNKLGRSDFFIPPTDLIAPESVVYLNKKYVVVNKDNEDGPTYYSFLFIPSQGYNSVVVPGWLRMFINSFNGVDVNVYLERSNNKDSILKDLRRNITYSRVNASETSDVSQTFDESLSSHESAQYIKNSLQNGEDFYHMAVMITVSGDSMEEVDDKIERLTSFALSYSIELKQCPYLTEACFKSTLPLCNLDDRVWEKAKRNCTTDGAASTYPFTTFEMNDENGIYFGDDVETNSPVLIDIFNTKVFQNANIFITGQSGSGKTYALMLMAIRMRIKHIPVYILAPEKEHEFRRICEAVGGQFIQIGPGSPNRINIMEIFKRDEKVSELIDGEFQRISYLTEKVTALKTFFQLLIQDISIEEKQLLDDAIMKTYRNFGITTDNESLYEPEDIMRKKFRKMPVIKDLQEVLASNPKTERMATILNVLCTGSGSSFNGQTNVDLDNPFTVIGLEHLSEEDMLPMGIYMAMDFVWSKIKEDRTKCKALFIDEWWKLASNEIAARYSLKIAKIIRAYGGAMILATQQMTDILAVENGKFGEAVLGNCKTKILLQMEEKDANNVQQMIGLNDTETTGIKRAKKGQALFISNENNIKVKFVASKKEHDLITTDRKELSKLAKTMRDSGDDFIEIIDAENEDNNQYFELDDIEIIEDATQNNKEVITEIEDFELIEEVNEVERITELEEFKEEEYYE